MTLSIDHEGLRLLATMEEPMSLDHLKRIAALNSSLVQFLKPYATQDFYHKVWDFDGVTALDDGFWVPGADSGATALAVASTQELGGIATGTTGTSDNDGIGMFGAPIVNGDNVAIMKTKFKLSVDTDVSFEIGFADVVTDKTLPVVTDVDTPATGNGAGDLAVVHMDTDQTLKTMAFVVDGSGTGMGAQKIDLGVLSPTANTYMTIMVAVYGNNALCVVNGERAYRKVIGNGIEGGTLLAPWLYFRTRSTTAVVPKIDYIELMGGRG